MVETGFAADMETQMSATEISSAFQMPGSWETNGVFAVEISMMRMRRTTIAIMAIQPSVTMIRRLSLCSVGSFGLRICGMAVMIRRMSTRALAMPAR